MSEEKKSWLDERRNVDRIYWGLVVICVALGIADFFAHRHVYFGWDGWFNFYGFFGFAAFWCIVIAGKKPAQVPVAARGLL